MPRKIHALKFELQLPAGPPIELIAWLDKNGDSKYLLHSHPDRSLLQAKAGDVVVFNRKTYDVLRVKPWRADDGNVAMDDTQFAEVESGEVWEAGGVSDDEDREQ